MNTTVELFLVDDDEDDREIFEYALQSVEYEINFSYVKNAREALGKLQNAVDLPHYIFLDLNMPGMNGAECLEAIKKMPHTRQIPVIVYSASNLPEHVEYVKDLQASHYLVKPYHLSELSQILAEILGGKYLPFLLPVTSDR